MHETSSQSDENKPVMQYEAVVTAENPVNITSEANASSSVEGIVKKKPLLCAGALKQEIVPFLLHEIVTLCVKSFEELGDECVAVAYAVAEFPFWKRIWI